MKEHHKFLAIMKANPDQLYVLATVIRIEGSAYRHEGAKMLFAENGQDYGLISGGCLEEDLAIKAQEVMGSGQNQTVSYDLRSEDDLGWGKGAGCNGRVHIFLEVQRWAAPEKRRLLARIVQALDNGDRIYSLKTVTDGEPGKSLYFTDKGELLNSWELSASQEVLRQFSESGKLFMLTEAAGQLWLAEVYEPEDTLYVFGAGRDAEPLVKRAAEFHFAVTVVDPRQDRCDEQFFPDAVNLVREHTTKFLKRNSLKKNGYVLMMTHSFEDDRKILEYVLAVHEDLAYAGILGPRRRTSRLLGGQDIPEWLHSPVGIDIRAEGADEISISIIAELIKVRREQSAALPEKSAVT